MESTPAVKKLVALALEEDLALGDITASLTVLQEHASRAQVVARQKLVVSGLAIVHTVVEAGGWPVQVDVLRQDGQEVDNDTVLVELVGPTRALLAAERTILNFLQRLCGVATFVRQVCAEAPALTILDTRKTMPGWRYLDKYSVRTGGACNHRFSLGDMILVKNNHIDAHPRGIRGALSDVKSGKPPYMRWEVEVRNLEELSVALEFAPDIIMLDNFPDDMIRQAVAITRARTPSPLLEVSGGVTKERLAALATLGVDAVSIGALTTRAPNADISMRIS